MNVKTIGFYMGLAAILFSWSSTVSAQTTYYMCGDICLIKTCNNGNCGYTAKRFSCSAPFNYSINVYDMALNNTTYYVAPTDTQERVILGTPYNDVIYGGYGKDRICGLEGDDYINGRRGNDFIQGNQGNDTIHGGRDQDCLRGGKDNDTIWGDLGEDNLRGDYGYDILNGGTDQVPLNDICDVGPEGGEMYECENGSGRNWCATEFNQ